MGYLPEETVYRLKFEKHEGLEVDTVSVPTGALLKMIRLADKASGSKSMAENLDVVQTLFEGFSDALVSWNLQARRGGQIVDVPATVEGMNSQPLPLVMEIIAAWIKAVAGVSAPLENDSKPGSTFPEGSLPMDPL